MLTLQCPIQPHRFFSLGDVGYAFFAVECFALHCITDRAGMVVFMPLIAFLCGAHRQNSSMVDMARPGPAASFLHTATCLHVCFGRDSLVSHQGGFSPHSHLACRCALSAICLSYIVLLTELLCLCVLAHESIVFCFLLMLMIRPQVLLDRPLLVRPEGNCHQRV